MQVHTYVCIIKYGEASIFFKHELNRGSQPQRDWLLHLASEQMTSCRRTRQESFVETEMKDWGSWSKGHISELEQSSKISLVKLILSSLLGFEMGPNRAECAGAD